MSVFDKRYCVVDKMGNYYRVNEDELLVEVEDEGSAQRFDILEANQRISNSGMSKLLRTVQASKIQCKKSGVTKVESNIMKVVEGELRMDEIDFAEILKELYFIYVNTPAYLEKLREKLSAVDEEICDILHFIELYQRDEEQSLDLVDQIQECRQRRREIKDDIYRIETFGRIFNTMGLSGILKDANKKLKKMEEREYVPRKLPGLFVQGIRLTEVAEENIVDVDDYYEEKDMEYNKYETIFDNQKNDWKTVVKQQAECFENIKQYRINLRIDLDGIEDQIEEMMVLCEDANCNVAQGYKMFKKIKDLRLERKEKIEELNKVETIISCFDCEAMASAYRYCVDEILGFEEVEEVFEETGDRDEIEMQAAI